MAKKNATKTPKSDGDQPTPGLPPLPLFTLTPVPLELVKTEINEFTSIVLANRYCHHAPFGDQAARYARIRQGCLELAILISQLAPPSRELAVALTHLDEVMFNANAAIARNEVEKPKNVDAGVKSPAEMVEQPKS